MLRRKKELESELKKINKDIADRKNEIRMLKHDD